MAKKKLLRKQLGMMGHESKILLQIKIIITIKEKKDIRAKDPSIQPQDTFKFLEIC